MNILKHEIEIKAKSFAFIGLGKQNMLCHQSICELVDDAIAAARPGEKARVYMELEPCPHNPEKVDLCVADWGTGMNLTQLTNALQLGSEQTSDSRWNEHGMGLNNALCSLSGEAGEWSILTRQGTGSWYMVHGPFAEQMQVEESDEPALPAHMHIPEDASTIILARTTMRYMQTLQRQNRLCRDLNALRGWLTEHLGVAYRGYLELNPQTMEPSAKIMIAIGDNKILVPPVRVPLCNVKVERFELELGGQVVSAEYHYGCLEEELRDHAVNGARARYYYQGNMTTQGIDIRIGKRVIATAQLDQIWHKGEGETGEGNLVRHPNYNDFLGEIFLPEMPRGVLPTMCNKTGIDAGSDDWVTVLDKLNEYAPVAKVRKASEQEIKRRWIKLLRATCPEDTVSDEIAVWPTAASIDVLQEGADNKCVVYELKANRAEPIHLYQLRMYWDGLVISGRQPTKGVLLVQAYSSDIVAMVNEMNKMPPPQLPDGTISKPYRFTVESHLGTITA